ncbi:uncharacterized protein N7446_010688 [Penicillium canescens]|uniref:Uncharacterized protein n=1 Tax=Penicillium canescens TaxID=5083 RepID=A0AAD6ICB3_PENCN|nr:uncharacterized protein N7446_010688 [Penicillium canescens]KAJ6041422.1 hypothetical protein N7460_006812 [Penicillium canescens]KAJ6050579.1 hypothetical protein N7446_010688 [Penicillium canescens]KAJ6065798.1 hypothetical protein N7444_001451 [Penicillium canescens]
MARSFQESLQKNAWKASGSKSPLTNLLQKLYGNTLDNMQLFCTGSVAFGNVTTEYLRVTIDLCAAGAMMGAIAVLEYSGLISTILKSLCL